MFDITVYCDDKDMVPFRATEGAIGYDVYSPQDFQLRHGEGIKLNTGLVMTSEKQPFSWGYILLPRSSSCKTFLSFINTAPVIEPEFQGPNDELVLGMKFEDLDVEEGGFLGKDVTENKAGRYISVKQGERIAQILFIPILLPKLKWGGKRENHPGGKSRGGFGSTGK
jgi:dUTPase